KVANGTTEPLKPVLILSFKRVWPMFVHMVVKGFILLIGFLLFIIPGVLLSIRYMFSELSLLNENLGPIAALGRSSKLTKGYRLNLYLKALGFTGIQFLLLVPILVFATIFGNNPMGPIFLEIYAFVSQLVFVYFYLDLLRIKGATAAQQATEPQLSI
ncbi:hypothetical protein GYA27_04190, partial [candidate division WWE3 bacterium]|nr:hypothetical protein [candidate division WWE3 bacterium]